MAPLHPQQPRPGHTSSVAPARPPDQGDEWQHSADQDDCLEGRYTLLGELGRGGLGRVFSASDDALGRPVAIKQPLSTSAESLARFEREAKITARLQHAGVVPVYDLGWSTEGEPFFVMKMVEGRSLADLIAARPALDERLALVPRVLAVADTVAYAHSQGIIHRDLKPANVIIGAFGEIVFL
jgi:eukaryotic-like serine/threonine-protein kinase